MKRYGRLIIAVTVIAAAILIFSAFYTTQTIENENADITQDYPQNYKIITPKVPQNLELFGEKVPVEDFDVFERMERELIVNTYWHSATIINLKRANRWFPVIEPILKKNGLPDDFKYLSMIESNLSNAISPAGAVGFWQFLKETGRKYGLEINDNIDERYHLEKATEAACQYLKNSYKEFGSWALAAASYNMGFDGVKNQLERQKTKNYYNLILNEETSRYMFRIVAAREIHNNPQNFGFDLKETGLYPPLQFYEVKVDTAIADLADFAKGFGINYKILKIFNPWLRDNFLQNRSGKLYSIKIPIKGTVTVIDG